jgi:hypothetical protein
MTIACRWAAALIVCAAAGCGPGLPPESDPQATRAGLVAALDAWKEGKTVDSLRGLTPPVDIVEPRWQGGVALESYEVRAQEKHGQGQRFTVALKLKPKGGPGRQQVATYIVEAVKTVIIRPEM